MNNTPKFVFMFAVAAIVVVGMLVLANSMFTESPIEATPSTSSENVNMTSDIISGVGTLGVDLLLPVLILIAVIVVISAIALFTKRR